LQTLEAHRFFYLRIANMFCKISSAIAVRASLWFFPAAPAVTVVESPASHEAGAD
jgi:hypothetical protein